MYDSECGLFAQQKICPDCTIFNIQPVKFTLYLLTDTFTLLTVQAVILLLNQAVENEPFNCYAITMFVLFSSV